ncbi:MAG: MFS transporter [Actinomycetota bacterium]|nr:MFS transporter [Actinomycetota bacterium]
MSRLNNESVALVSGDRRRLGMRANWAQFSIYTLITLLIGVTIGTERVALPPLARRDFGITSILYTVSFIAAFGLVKSLMNLVSGRLSDNRGRRRILLAGWAFAVPFALLIIFARSWWWVIVANLFLGVNQALTWTMSVTAKIDLVGPSGRGLAVGIDESAGYVGVGVGGFIAGLLVAHYGLRPAPYLLALGVVAVGAVVTLLAARETLPWARLEAARSNGGRSSSPQPRLLHLAAYMSWKDRSMLAVCQAGMVNKFADSLVAAFFPLYFLRRGVTLSEVGLLVGVYAWVWGLGQVVSGALADKVGRKLPITGGTFLIAGGMATMLAGSARGMWFAGAAVMGVGMALVYPNLITAVGDSAHPSWRGGALGVYRLWRDSGYAIGPLLLGGVAAAWGMSAAMWTGASVVFASGVVLALLLRETSPRHAMRPPAWQAHPELLGHQAAAQ